MDEIMVEGTSAQPIKVLIVDDHPLFRAGLEKALSFEDDLSIVGHTDKGENVLELTKQLVPDVILLDVNLPGMNGLQVARQLKQQHVRAAIVILTAHHDEEQILHALRSGASAYCPKDIHPNELIALIREVAHGVYLVGQHRMSVNEIEAWLNAQIERIVGSHIVDPEGHFIPLSPREMEILVFVTQGLLNKEIAAKLSISEQTVKNHMTSILKKLHAKDRTHAAVMALRRGWVRIQSDPQEELRGD